jgi:hypothetical protein
MSNKWVTLVVVLLVGYLLGVWKPSYGQMLISKLS